MKDECRQNLETGKESEAVTKVQGREESLSGVFGNRNRQRKRGLRMT